MMRIEICVDSVTGAMAAQSGGADRVELCSNLVEGGTTPSAGTLKLARRSLRVGIQVLIRPRGGDFLYSDTEMEVMREDIRIARELGADGVVIGCLTAGGDIDREKTAELMALARPMKVTFHRAFDVCRDARSSLEELIALGVDRVLTSGQAPSCESGIGMIRALQIQAAGRIIILPGGGLTPANVRAVVDATGVSEVHLSARSAVESKMEFRNEAVRMGGTPPPSEFVWKSTDQKAVAAVVAALRS